MRISEQPAYILHHYPYGETSLILEVFTRDHGRLGLMAKGARRAKAEVRANLRPFQPLLVGCAGRGELPALTQVEPEPCPAPHLVGTGLLCAFYLNELILRLLQREDPHEELYGAYRAALDALQAPGAHEAALRVFEKRLLRALGYGLVLEHDGSGVPIAAEAEYRYVLDQGPRRTDDPYADGVAIRGASLLALRDEKFHDDHALAQAKTLLRAVLAQYVGDRPLQTRRLFQRLKTAPASEAT